MINTYLFDLDGTLTDPYEGITNSVKYALQKFGIEENRREILVSFIGPPLLDSFNKIYGFDNEKAYVAIKNFREYFSEYGIFENKLYEGIEDVLSELKKKGKILGVCTSKPEEFANKILEKFGILRYFDFVSGAEMDQNGRLKKDEIIEYTLNKYGIDENTAVMVGDRIFDILGAKKFGIKSVGCLYGYGTREELNSAGADYITENIISLKEVLLSL